MSVVTGASGPGWLRALAFGDPDGEGWGAAWILSGSAEVAALSVGGQAASMAAELEGDNAHEVWCLALGDSHLVLAGAGDPVESPMEPQTDFDQLCRVSGTLAVEGQTREVSCLGWRSVRSPAFLAADVASLRQVVAWLGPEDGFALAALRSARAKGQDADVVSAALFAPSESKPAADPRLSTTYDDAGRPVRAGVELWIQAGEDPDQQYPRRAVGESLGAPVRWKVDGVDLEAQPFYWHAGGREGPGIYLLGQRT